MTGEQIIQEYLEVLSSKAPVPGGGGASALGGALSAALGLMVIHLTVGKKKYADVQQTMEQFLETLEQSREKMLRLADRDAQVFAPLAAAYGLPSETPKEKEKKEIIMEKNLLAASLVPLEIMEQAVAVIEILQVLAAKGSRMAVSDVGVAVQFARTALTGAVMNVYINTKSMKDREKAEKLNHRAEELLSSGVVQADAVYEQVRSGLKA